MEVFLGLQRFDRIRNSTVLGGFGFLGEMPRKEDSGPAQVPVVKALDRRKVSSDS